MTPEQLSALCRCGHARRKHATGNIFEGYSTKCHEFHRQGEPGYDGPDCFYFEPAADIVVMRRDRLGRFVKVRT